MIALVVKSRLKTPAPRDGHVATAVEYGLSTLFNNVATSV